MAGDRVGSAARAQAAAQDVHEQGIEALQAGMARGSYTSQDLVRAYLARIAAFDQRGPALNAIAVLAPDAMAQARMRDRERAAGRLRGPLHGIPILAKDNCELANLQASAGSLALATPQPGREAGVVRRLREAGAVILGRTAMHELASGITNASSLTGLARNPYDIRRVPGGSSGGSGAAVAACLAAAALGTDTSGSVRLPAAVNNLYGLRPTIGLASRAGIVPLSTTQDTPGPLARSVEDLAILLDAMAGSDPDDPATRGAARHLPASFRQGLRPGALAGARIGLLQPCFGTQADEEEISAVAQRALQAMQDLGASLCVVRIQLEPALRESSLTAFEFREALADYLAQRQGSQVSGLGEILEQGLHHEQLDAVLRLREDARDPDGSGRAKALRQRGLLRRAVLACMRRHGLDALAYPSLRRRPAMLGEIQAGANSQLSAATGMPALCLPAGFTRDGLPVGVELLGPDWSESRLLDYAWHWQQAMAPRRAPFTTPALVRGRPPGPWRGRVALKGRARANGLVQVEVDPVRAVLRFDARAEVAHDDALLAMTVHRPAAPGAARGPVIAHLLRDKPRARGELALRGDMVEALQGAGLEIWLHTRLHPLGAAQAVLAMQPSLQKAKSESSP